ncbi:synaptotagmin-like protein 3 [Chanos chanos]|uniref:Synaptotagmin-like protein 3 n=1 Tax=Chanos chanos TaxID=29144 RepID=A0A6J2W0I0_CHACN|nr:synaptotagmin-like protein 3 [Chanos chanos]
MNVRETMHGYSMDLSLLQALEREKVLEVLQRDKALRTIEEERIRKLKSELQEIRRKGAKSFACQYSERTCARCQRPLGKFWNCGAVCRGCSHRICSKCRVSLSAHNWTCTVCHAYREVKFKSGEWFLEVRAKKFPRNSEVCENTGERLLQTYRRLSHISVVPPTPPPCYDGPSSSVFDRTGGLKSSKPFTKSMENLMVSVTSHIKKISRSQNDLRTEQVLLTVDDGRRSRKSQSDTALNISSGLKKVPSLPSLLRKPESEGQQDGGLCADDEASLQSGYSSDKRWSSSSTGTEPEMFDNVRFSGEINLAVCYSSSASCLEIQISSCRNLTSGDFKKTKCHPYVKLYILPEKSVYGKMKTSIKKNTTEPVYNQVFQCSIERNVLVSSTLQVSVWHVGTLKKKVFLGETLIPLAPWALEDCASQGAAWYSLGPKLEVPVKPAVVSEELLISVRFTSLSQPSWAYRCTDDICIGVCDAGVLSVLVKGIQNQPASRSNPSLNTYIRG